MSLSNAEDRAIRALLAWSAAHGKGGFPESMAEAQLLIAAEELVTDMKHRARRLVPDPAACGHTSPRGALRCVLDKGHGPVTDRPVWNPLARTFGRYLLHKGYSGRRVERTWREWITERTES